MRHNVRVCVSVCVRSSLHSTLYVCGLESGTTHLCVMREREGRQKLSHPIRISEQNHTTSMPFIWGTPKAAPPPPPTPHLGVPNVFADALVLQWGFGLLGLHIVLQILFGRINTPFQAKPGVAAHQVCAFIPFCYAAYHGSLLWLFDEEIALAHAGTFTDRLYAKTESGWLLCRFMIGFQLYDLLSTALEPSLRKAEHLAHHTATMLTALSAATAGGPFFGFYAAFFFGFVEVSSVPLAFVDLFRQIPALAKQFSMCNELVRTSFAVSFLIIRVGCFPWLMLTRWWPDLLAAYNADDIRCPQAAYCWMFFSSAFLTFLQLFWGFKIIRVITKGNMGGKDASAAQAED